MKLFAFGLSALAAFALSAGTASAQYVVRGGHTHGGGAVVSPGYGGYVQPAPTYGRYVQPAPSYGGSLYTPGYGGSQYTPNYGGYAPIPRGHYDYIPTHVDRHRGHLDVHPGHYDYHTPGTRSPRH